MNKPQKTLLCREVFFITGNDIFLREILNLCQKHNYEIDNVIISNEEDFEGIPKTKVIFLKEIDNPNYEFQLKKYQEYRRQQFETKLNNKTADLLSLKEKVSLLERDIEKVKEEYEKEDY